MPNQNAPLHPTVLLFLASIFLFLCFGCNGGGPETRNVLVFSKTAGYRHASIAQGKQMFLEMGQREGFNVDTTEDAGVFTEDQLSKYNVVVFLSTTGDILNDTQQRELERFMQAGGSWMGVHAAADTEYDWPWYNRLAGAYFLSHPTGTPEADLKVVDRAHPATQHLPETWHRSDEWYNYKKIQDDLNVLMRLDESSYEGGENGANHPISWYKNFENGRSFYTGLGHTAESYSEPEFIEHIKGGLDYLFGKGEPVDYANVREVPEENRFPVETLVEGMLEPMELEILPDGRPIWTRRGGEIMLYDMDFEQATKVGELDVWTEYEDGLLGIAADPNFAENEWLYLYYSPNGEKSVNRLSRFKFTNNKLANDTEQVILEVPTDRNKCCHSAGSIEFGGKGLLHLSIGDNTNPFESDGFSPIDDSRDIPNFDARRSSANTQDLRGGIIRIKVEEDGSYSIPEGNLFSDPADGRPEIYAMGMRNPFRIHVDRKNGNVYWGDVGPDAGEDSLGMGPRGHDEVNVATEPGFFGWPLFIGDNKPYHARDFASGELGEAFDPAAPLNDSEFNTGARRLPPAQPAMIYYPYAASEEFPQMGEGGRNAMAGPVYYADLFPEAATRYPDYYNGKFFFYDWMRDQIMVGTLDNEGYVTEMERFLPSLDVRHPMDMTFGPDGALYILEYGRRWFSLNPDARLLRIPFNSGNRPPYVGLEVAETIGAAPFSLGADAGASGDYDGDSITVSWALNGQPIGEGETLDHTIEAEGIYELTVTVDDGREGHAVSQTKQLIVGNSVPRVDVAIAGNRSFFFGNRPLDYDVTVTDVEDGTIDPEAITVSIDYLEGEDLVEIQRGHQVAGQSTAFAIGEALIDNADCAGCHQQLEASIGPSYLAIAERYRTDESATDYLAGKIISGGNGVWGEQAMSAHPDLPEGDAKQMADYILSLAGPAPNAKSRPTKGKIVLDQHRAGTPGRYIVQASYTDKGAGEGLPRLTTNDVVVLRNPLIPAHKFVTGKKVLAYRVKAEDNPMADEDGDVLVGIHNGWAGYGDLDLTGISEVKASVVLVPNATSGGTIEIIRGEPTTGEILGSATIEQGISTYGINELSIPIKGTTDGPEPIYFRFTAADANSPDAIMGAVITLEFLPGKPSK